MSIRPTIMYGNPTPSERTRRIRAGVRRVARIVLILLLSAAAVTGAGAVFVCYLYNRVYLGTAHLMEAKVSPNGRLRAELVAVRGAAANGSDVEIVTIEENSTLGWISERLQESTDLWLADWEREVVQDPEGMPADRGPGRLRGVRWVDDSQLLVTCDPGTTLSSRRSDISLSSSGATRFRLKTTMADGLQFRLVPELHQQSESESSSLVAARLLADRVLVDSSSSSVRVCNTRKEAG